MSGQNFVTDMLNASTKFARRERLRLYREMVDAIAHNDGHGDKEALQIQYVSEITSVVLAASVFGKTPYQVARAVVRIRRSA